MWFFPCMLSTEDSTANISIWSVYMLSTKDNITYTIVFTHVSLLYVNYWR